MKKNDSASHKSLKKEIQINAPVLKVWQVFTDPEITREMGGEYVSDWFVGSSFGWKGLDGKMYTNGTVLALESQKLLTHSLVDEKGTESSVITYEFIEVPFDESGGDQTILKAREVFTKPLSEKAYTDATEGWDAA